MLLAAPMSIDLKLRGHEETIDLRFGIGLASNAHTAEPTFDAYEVLGEELLLYSKAVKLMLSKNWLPRRRA